MRNGMWAGVLALAVACSKGDTTASAPVGEPTNRPSPAHVSQPSPRPEAKPPSRIARELEPLLARLSYKPDPYATQPGCIAEERAQVREQLLLSVQMRLARGADGSLSLVDRVYAVSDAPAFDAAESAAQLGIPRLEAVHADGRVDGVDFEGEFVEPGDRNARRTRDEVPRDPTWVSAWLATIPVASDVVAHRVTLDGRVLAEQKRPSSAPRLSTIECDDTRADGVHLSWKASAEDAAAALYVDVLAHGPAGFHEVLPLADARTVEGLTLTPADRPTDRDLVLLVAVTDTFRIVTRGVLVPKKAL